MAPTSDAASPTTPATLAGRITKSHSGRSGSRVRRSQRRMLSSASSSHADVLQSMVEEAQDVVVGANSMTRNKGKGRARKVKPTPTEGHHESITQGIASSMDVDQTDAVAESNEKLFPIMELPTEIRLEIYRACLTRPYNILLSKREKVVIPEPETACDDSLLDESFSSAESEEDISVSQSSTTPRTRSRSRRPAAMPSSAYNVSTRSTRSNRAGSDSGPSNNYFRAARRAASQSAPSSTSSTSSSSISSSSSSIGGSSNSRSTNSTVHVASPRRRQATLARTSNVTHFPSREPPRRQKEDPLLVNVLRVSKEMYKEARSVLYSENIFTLDLNTAMTTLACLHQRSRRQIKHVELEVPTYNEILERFQETVRLSLRYCSGLKQFIIHMPFTLPGADGSGTTGNTTVYANGFDILRWLPQDCEILLKGNICKEIETVVNKHRQLAGSLDQLAYARRQLISNETGSTNILTI